MLPSFQLTASYWHKNESFEHAPTFDLDRSIPISSTIREACSLCLVARNFYEFIGSPEKASKNTTSEVKAINIIKTAKSKHFTRKEESIEVKLQNEKESTFVYDSEKESKYKKNQQKRIHLRNCKASFLCISCQRCFSKKTDLKRHELIHTGEKPFQCKTCNKCFNRAGNLKYHERIHTGEKPFQCKTCNKRFRDSSAMRKHERTHANKPFKIKS